MYQIWIKTDRFGSCGVGAKSIHDNRVVDCEKIYPSQMCYRVTAMDENGAILICTRTEAKQNDWSIIGEFPAANGALKRGY